MTGNIKIPSKVLEHQEGSTAGAMHITMTLYHAPGRKDRVNDRKKFTGKLKF